MTQTFSKTVEAGAALQADEVAALVASALAGADFEGKKLLLIVPDGTRTAPVGAVFKAIHRVIGERVAQLDVLIALGTHQPMSEAAIRDRLEISESEREGLYKKVAFHNHRWNDPEALTEVGTIPSEKIAEVSEDLFSMDVPVEVNKLLFDYDHAMVIGPVFPHEVVGFSGGGKYFFPGVGGPRILNFFHWLGAVVSNPKIIGSKWTPVRKVVDLATGMVPVEKSVFCLVVAPDKSFVGIHYGDMQEAWDVASEQSRLTHITYKDRPYHTVLSCAQPMYDELWTAGKAMYKLEPVVADGGELIIYAPHLSEVCVSHGETLMKIGYHTRDYFLKQWDQFKDYPWGVLAHSSHVRGIGTFEDGVEKPRIQVTIASQIPEAVCHQLNLGYRDPASIDVESYADREEEGVLLVRKAGEMLYRLKNSPEWSA